MNFIHECTEKSENNWILLTTLYEYFTLWYKKNIPVNNIPVNNIPPKKIFHKELDNLRYEKIFGISDHKFRIGIKRNLYTSNCNNAILNLKIKK